MRFLWKAKRLVLLLLAAIVLFASFICGRRLLKRQPAQVSVSLDRAKKVILSSSQVSQVAPSQVGTWNLDLKAKGFTEMQADFVPEVESVGVALSIPGSSEMPVSVHIAPSNIVLHRITSTLHLKSDQLRIKSRSLGWIIARVPSLRYELNFLAMIATQREMGKVILWQTLDEQLTRSSGGAFTSTIELGTASKLTLPDESIMELDKHSVLTLYCLGGQCPQITADFHGRAGIKFVESPEIEMSFEADANQVEVNYPFGKIAIGREMEDVTGQSLIVKASDKTAPFSITVKQPPKSDQYIQISGKARSAQLGGEELIKPPWAKWPPEVQAAVVGIVATIVVAVVTRIPDIPKLLDRLSAFWDYLREPMTGGPVPKDHRIVYLDTGEQLAGRFTEQKREEDEDELVLEDVYEFRDGRWRKIGGEAMVRKSRIHWHYQKGTGDRKENGETSSEPNSE